MSQASFVLWSSQISFIVMALAIDTIIYNLSRMHEKIIIATPIFPAHLMLPDIFASVTYRLGVSVCNRSSRYLAGP